MTEYSEERGLLPKVAYLSRSQPFRKLFSVSQHQQIPINLQHEMYFMPHIHLHVGNFYGLILFRLCACCHSCCECRYATSLLCPENTISLSSSTISGSYLSSHYSTIIPEFFCQGCKKVTPFRLEHTQLIFFTG